MITGKALKELAAKFEDDQLVPINIAYGSETIDYIFVRLDDASIESKSINLTLSLIDSEDESK